MALKEKKKAAQVKVQKNPETQSKAPSKPKKSDAEIAEEKRLSAIADKRNLLINEIKPKLLSVGALRRGGPSNRAKYNREQANYLPVIQEINELGRQLSFRDIGLGNLRS